MSDIPTIAQPNGQWIRRCSLIVSGASGRGIELSGMDPTDPLGIVFRTSAADSQTPNTAEMRIYNLSPQTVRQVKGEFTKITLQAGYATGKFGVIFQGTIKQFRSGKENETDTFLDILAADGDTAYNFATLNTTLAAGSTVEQRWNKVAGSFGPYDIAQGHTEGLVGGVLPRGKVMFGMARDYAHDITQTTGTQWSIQNGRVQVIKTQGYLPNQVIDINSQTGMIGIPEATDNGIQVRCFLNHLIIPGIRIRLNNADITQTKVLEQGYPSYTDTTFVASTNKDGIYRTLVAEHKGETRGQDWYTDIVCLNLDPSSPPPQINVPSR